MHKDVLEEEGLPEFTEQQKKLLKGKIDFWGVNFYGSHFVTNGRRFGSSYVTRSKKGSSCAKGSCLPGVDSAVLDLL